MKKPKIGITLRVVTAINYDEKRDALSQDWPKLLEELNIIPVYIPNTLENISNYLDELSLDGVIFSGGENIGENKERDCTEKKLLEYALSKKLPILGICRGMQLINEYFGGRLTKTNSDKHITKKHELQIIDNKFQTLFQSSVINTNSYHSNLIMKNQIGKKLKPFVIFTNDDSVEGFFHETLPILGVMWHPERNFGSDDKLILSTIFMNNFFWLDEH
jgi:N5-(cytidine 5'-diphosphoramidyl)-L-glutamine hydrolase